MPKRHPEREPQRSCAVCRRVAHKRAMTRVVRGPDGAVSVDRTGRANGRGAYVCDDPACHEPLRLADGIRRALGVHVAAGALSVEVRDATA